MKTKPHPRFSAVSAILIVVAIFLPGCGGVNHDCQNEGHSWVTGKSGETRCKHCGIYQTKETTSGKKESKEYELDTELEVALDKSRIIIGDDLGFDTTNAVGFITPFLRIALNAIVAMTYGTEWQKLKPTRNEQQTVKNRKKQIHAKNTKGKPDAMRAALRLGMMPEFFQFDQKIKAFEDHRSDSNKVSDHHGTSKKPHWRRGHWRQQAVGQGRTQRELTWIRPMLINARQFKGDLKDTTTTYTAS